MVGLAETTSAGGMSPSPRISLSLCVAVCCIFKECLSFALYTFVAFVFCSAAITAPSTVYSLHCTFLPVLLCCLELPAQDLMMGLSSGRRYFFKTTRPLDWNEAQQSPREQIHARTCILNAQILVYFTTSYQKIYRPPLARTSALPQFSP